MPWAAVFGLPYVELFGRTRLLTAPAYAVRELHHGGVYIQLMEDMLAPVAPPSKATPEENYAWNPRYARSAAKGHLGSDGRLIAPSPSARATARRPRSASEQPPARNPLPRPTEMVQYGG